MKNRLFTILTFAISLGAIVIAILIQRAGISEAISDISQPGEILSPSESTPERVVKIKYFTSSGRNQSCLKIEALIHRTIEKRFAEEAVRGAVIFELIDIDFPENKRYLNNFQVEHKTVVVAKYIKGVLGDWVNLHDVGLMLTNPEDFEQYIAEAVNALLLE